MASKRKPSQRNAARKRPRELFIRRLLGLLTTLWPRLVEFNSGNYDLDRFLA